MQMHITISEKFSFMTLGSSSSDTSYGTCPAQDSALGGP
jgi:hypothetical protein